MNPMETSSSESAALVADVRLMFSSAVLLIASLVSTGIILIAYLRTL